MDHGDSTISCPLRVAEVWPCPLDWLGEFSLGAAGTAPSQLCSHFTGTVVARSYLYWEAGWGLSSRDLEE